jgi:hypothetical protein
MKDSQTEGLSQFANQGKESPLVIAMMIVLSAILISAAEYLV